MDKLGFVAQLEDSLQGLVARSRLGVWLSLKIGNQCRAIVGKAHGARVFDMALNGEAAIIQHVSKSLRKVVDVGANRGEWTRMVLKSTPSVEACLLFEPGTAALEALRKTFAEQPKVLIIGAAAGDSVGQLSFYEEPNAGERSSLVAGTFPDVTEHTVKVTTLDTEIEQLGWPNIDYFKIDAEGYDFQVLKGARNLFADKRIALGQFEYNVAWAPSGSTLTYALNWLKDLGYECFLLKRNKLYVPRPEVYGEYFRYSNYVFCHAGSKELIASLIAGVV